MTWKIAKWFGRPVHWNFCFCQHTSDYPQSQFAESDTVGALVVDSRQPTLWTCRGEDQHQENHAWSTWWRHPEYVGCWVTLPQHLPEWSLSWGWNPHWSGQWQVTLCQTQAWAWCGPVDYTSTTKDSSWTSLRSAPSGNFGLYLLLKVFLFLFSLWWMPWPIPQLQITFFHCVSKWPETLMESDEDRVNKRAIWVVSEQPLKDIDINLTNDFERSGQSLIIICLTQSLSATGLGCSNGLMVNEYPAVGPYSSSSTSHRYSLAHLGLLPLAQYCSSLLAWAFHFNISFFPTPNANVSVTAVRCLLHASSLVEQLT